MQALYLWIDVKKGGQTRLKLLFDLVFAAFEGVHGDMRIPSVFQFDGGRAHLRDLVGGQQSQPVNQRQVCHLEIVSQRWKVGKFSIGRGVSQGAIAGSGLR